MKITDIMAVTLIPSLTPTRYDVINGQQHVIKHHVGLETQPHMSIIQSFADIFIKK